MRLLQDGKSVGCMAISQKACALLGNAWVIRILKHILQKPDYPKSIARSFGEHEQKIYYYMRQLETAQLIEVVRTKQLQGTIAKYYAPTAESFAFLLAPLSESAKTVQKESVYLSPFIVHGKLNAQIIVGSPDPHGPLKARSKDGYFGMDLALFLGTFLHSLSALHVRLDTEVHEKDLADMNLIVIGGPIVNKVAALINAHSPIQFRDKSVYDTRTKRQFVQEEIGLITKFANPFNKQKSVLYIAGLRNAGTRAAITAFVTAFSQVESLGSCVVEGIDLDSDGVIDSVDFV